MLMTTDSQLKTISTPNGPVQFVQIVGITSDELLGAQHWNGCGVLEIMKRSPESGGPWLITNMRRGESIYDIDPLVADEIENGIETEGSNLSGVSAKISWQEVDPNIIDYEASFTNESNIELESEMSCRITKDVSEQIKTTLKKGLLNTNCSVNDVMHQSNSDKTSFPGGPSTDSAELYVTVKLPSLHITMNLESGALLPLALRGRLKHGRHFTFKSIVGNSAVTLVPPSVSGAFVDSSNPYATHGPWLQVYIPHNFIETMYSELSVLANPDEVSVPIVFKWPSRKLVITIVGEVS